MKPHKINVERGDTCIVELIITDKQPEGRYEYIPTKGDEITVYIKNSKNTVVCENTLTIDVENTERISIRIPTHLPPARYTYDIILNCSDGEKHTVCDENILIIKEDDAYA